jgi:hypothetical protein
MPIHLTTATRRGSILQDPDSDEIKKYDRCSRLIGKEGGSFEETFFLNLSCAKYTILDSHKRRLIDSVSFLCCFINSRIFSIGGGGG